jgi:biopolymer transport protein TolR
VGAQLGNKGMMSELNLTPLIDIVLVVLIIMMVNIPIQIERMLIKLPSNVEVENREEVPTDQLVVAIYEKQPGEEDNVIALNRRRMTEEQLFFQVTRRLRSMENKNVFIDGAPAVVYGRMVDIMDLAREAGANKVGLARLKPTGPLPPNSVEPGAMERGMLLGSPTVVGVMSVETADKGLKPALGSMEACYFKELSAFSDLSGRIMLRITVAPDGSLMRVKVASNSLESEKAVPAVQEGQPLTGGPAVEACILSKAESLKYEPIGAGNTAIVQYPILFSPG